MSPRLQCLDAPRQFMQRSLLSKVAFSTTTRALTDEPPSSATDLLSSVGDHPARIQLPSRPRRSAVHTPSGLVGRKQQQQGNAHANKHLMNLISKAKSRGASLRLSESGENVIQELKKHKLASDLTKQISRRWKAGDIYAPHDLSSVEMQKWKRRGVPEYDAFDQLDMNPIGEYKNFSIMSEYMTPMGRILPSTETGLRRVNQRRISKAIRRSIGLGLMPSVHRHPEILYKMNAKLRSQLGRMTTG